MLSVKIGRPDVIAALPLPSQLPQIAEKVGKKQFKQHIELFLDSLNYSLTGSHVLSKAAAEECVG